MQPRITCIGRIQKRGAGFNPFFHFLPFFVLNFFSQIGRIPDGAAYNQYGNYCKDRSPVPNLTKHSLKISIKYEGRYKEYDEIKLPCSTFLWASILHSVCFSYF